MRQRIFCFSCLFIHFSLLAQIELNQWQVYCSQEEINPIQEYEFQTTENLDRLILCLKGEKKGYALLKTEFHLDNPNLDYGFLAGRLPWADRVYLNGKKIGENGKFPPNPLNYFNIHRFYKLPKEILNFQKSNEIRILLFLYAEGGILDTPLVGEFKNLQIKARYRDFFNNTIYLIVFFLLIIVGIYHLLIYFKRPNEKENLYYSLTLLFYAGYDTNMYIWSLPEPLTHNYLFWNKLVIFFLFACLFSLNMFFASIFQQSLSTFTQRLLVFFSIAPVVILFLTPEYSLFFQLRIYAYLIVFIFVVVYIYQITIAIKNNNRIAKLIFLGLIPAILLGLFDLVASIFQWTTTIFLGPLGIPVFLSSIALILVDEFVNARNEVEYLNKNLELKVKERTKELQESLTQVNELKQQQDADYYLASLLIKPFNINRAYKNSIQMQVFSRQKKTFLFRNKEHEIGGDLNSVYEIRLLDKNYIAFLNGDAMGKSMQGACGALTLGVIFKAKVTRTQSSEKESNKTPELWLNECWLELEQIFEEFEGSMFISCIVGLVDRETGVLYFFNAEHPLPILYRDNKASLLESHFTKKVGASRGTFQVQINVFQIHTGDSIIFGSDGRDDLLIGYEEKTRVINQDQNLFLKCVEEGEGEISAIVDTIQKKGELTDDLSLLKITRNQTNYELVPEHDYNLFKEAPLTERKKILEKLLQDYPNDYRLYKIKADSYFRKKDYLQAAQSYEQVYKLHPISFKNIYQLALCEKKLKNYSKSMDWIMILYLREPKNITTLFFLAKLYASMGDYKMAVTMLNYLLDIEKEYKPALKLKEKLKTLSPSLNL